MKKKSFSIMISALISLTMNILTYWSYDVIGIVSTSIYLTLSPILAIIGSRLFLKDLIEPKYFLGTAVISACVAISIIF